MMLRTRVRDSVKPTAHLLQQSSCMGIHQSP